MAYCMNCGKELPDGAKFCFECGKPVQNNLTADKPTAERKLTYDGAIHRCPNCGDVLDAYELKCELCGWEVRTGTSKSTVQEFVIKLQEIESRVMVQQKKGSLLERLVGTDFKRKSEEEARKNFEQQKEKEKINLISTFIVPNTKEDILELLQLAVSKIFGKKKLEDEVSKAWIVKLKQCDQKAKLMLAEDKEYLRFQELNRETYDKLKIERAGKLSWRSLFGF